MSNIQEMQQERQQMRADLLAHKVPKRVPIHARFSAEAACGLAGVDLMEAHYNSALMEKAAEAVCDNFYSDMNPFSNIRFPAAYQLLQAKNWIMSSTGVIQHPEIEVMTVEDYEDYTAAPYSTILEKFLPRVCEAMRGEPLQAALALARAYDSYTKDAAANGGIMARTSAKYGYSAGMVTGAMVEAPFDFVADQLRGFKGITMDVRRCPDKIEAAANATLPLMVKVGTPTVMREGIIDFCPLHLAPYINMKAFESLWWPTFKLMCEQLDAKGIATNHYCEQDFTRYAEHLATLPKSNSFLFEDGDYRHIKKTAGKDHVIGGFYDPTITLSKTKEECIDVAKELLDGVMDGGKYYFAFDKSIMDIKSIDVPKLAAVLEWVRDNAVY